MEAGDLCLEITDIQTAMVIPTDLEPSRSRRFIISATDGRIKKEIRLVQLERKSLRWDETLDYFIVGSSSQLTLRVLEEHRLRNDKLLATFVLPYQMLCSCQQEFLLSITQKTSSHTLSVTSLIRRIPLPTLPYVGEIDDEPLPAPLSVIADVLVVGVADTSSNGNAGDSTEVVVTSARTLLDKWKLVINQIDFVLCAVDSISEIHCHAKLARSVFSVIQKTILEEIQLRVDNDVMVFLDAIADALRLTPGTETLDAIKLRSHCEQSEKRKEAVKCMMNLITECGYFIQSYIKDSSFRQRLDACKQDVIANFREQLRHLHNAFIEENTVNIDIDMVRILGQMECMNGLLEDIHLDTKFPFVQGARFNPEGGCLPGTRVKFLAAITNWVNDIDPLSSKALVLFGQAGTGKSSIAHEIANRFHRTGRLTTSYCFIRGRPSSREPYRFFTTLAHNLCARYPAFKASLNTVIKNNPDITSAEDYTTLFNALILEPLKGLQFVSPVFVVIDALDESEDASLRHRTGGKKIPFHTFLGQHLFQFPKNFCILITSRPETDILKALAKSSFVHHMYMNDPELADAVDNDILIYMQKNLHQAEVDDSSLHKLVNKAEHIFQWASVACNYIGDPPRGLNSQHCIQRLLHPSDSRRAAKPLDAVYMTVLENFDMDDEDVRNNFRSVMGQILGAFEPLSIEALDTLRVFGGVDFKTSVFDIVKEMGSLLSNIPPPGLSSLVAPVHTSFRDFLIDPNRSGKFYVDVDAARGQLAYATLRTMQTMLHFNICDIETSHCLNNEVPDLDNRIEAFIPSVLSYACRFWADHLVQVSNLDAELFSSVRDLMEAKFLFWLEVLSVRGEMEIATKALLSLKTWLDQMRDNVQDDRIEALYPLVRDAIAFVRYFGYPMARSVPHIYISALPFAPAASLIAKQYSSRFRFTLNVEHGRLMQWPALVMAISMPEKPQVVCVAWSRNDEYIAVGLADGNVFVWIASTGTKVCGPIGAGRKGRRDRVFVSSIVFSHDGLYLASGLSDGRIRIWQLMTGQEAVVGILKAVGHISALSFSKDGKQLVSGSGDHMIRIWDLDKGEVVVGPFSGHENPVWAVSFFPDQEHVVSWSGFCTVRVWNVKTGERVMDLKSFKEMDIPLGTIDATVHCADSVDFHHDKRYVKSGFTACSWTKAMYFREETFQPEGLYSHYWTQAAAFSGNTKFVATCDPHHVRIWHANGESAGQLAGGPFRNDRVICLGFSADGQRMATGSWDGIMRVWNVGTVDENLGVSAKQGVSYSVAFDHDGKQIVVGRQDGTIQLLDVLTGEEVVKIRERDEKHVCQPEVAASRNGDLISSTWEKQILIHTRTGPTFTTGPLRSSNKNICCVAFSLHSDSLFAFGTSDGTVCVVDASTGMQIAEPKQICTEAVSSLALSSSPIDATTTIRPQIFVAVGSNGEIFLWDTDSGHTTGPSTRHRDWVRALVFSADGRRITSAAEDYSLCVWDLMTGNTVMRSVLSDMHSQPSGVFRQAIALTQDGRKVAFTGKHHVILLYDVLYKNGNEVNLQRPLVLAGHQNFVNRMAFSNDGQFLATTSDDHTIRIWGIQAAVDHQQAITNFDSDPGIGNFNEAVIDDDGWAICASGDGLPLRLMWIPEMHRESLRRPASVCVVGRDPRKETRLDLENFVHGRDWVNCKV